MSPLVDKAMDPTSSQSSDAAGDSTIAVAVAEPELRRQVLAALNKICPSVGRQNCGGETPDQLIASIERSHPGILILGLPGLADSFEILARISAMASAPLILAVNDCADPEIILQAMRAGAAEFVYRPLDSPAFAESMRRVIAACGRVAHRGRTGSLIAGFVSAKGGCGATTLACHSSTHLRRATNKEVLLADLDTACGIAGSIMQTVARYSVSDAVQNLHRMDLQLWKGLVATGPSGVDVMPAAPGKSSVFVPVSRHLPQLARFWTTHYDFTFLDLGHGTTPALLDVLDSLDTLVLVATNEVPALRQAKDLLQTLAARNFASDRLKLVINRMPKRMQIQLPELERVMGHPIYCTIPNDYERLNEAYSESRLLDPGSDLALQIGGFASRLGGIGVSPKAPRRFFGLRGKT
jgi:pilus assembly protein CpaE